MPLCSSVEGVDGGARRYKALAAVAAFNAAQTIEPALASITKSIRFYRARHHTADHPIAISVVDDASTDRTAAIVASFARTTDVDVHLTVNDTNCGRGRCRNRALAIADAEYHLFLDHDDEYLPEHISACLDALADGHVDYVKTGVYLSNAVHEDWERRIAGSLTQNLCTRAYCHRIIGGFHEEPEVETYGCDDVLYNRTLRSCFRGTEIPERTIRFLRRPGNSFDRQYERKFSRPAAAAELTLSSVQQSVEACVVEIHDRRLREVRDRMQRLAGLARATSRAHRYSQ